MRSKIQKIKDFISLPLRSFTLFEQNKWGLTSMKDERFEYAASEVLGRCLDIGCGRGNSFIKKHLSGNGVGIDVFKYEGLEDRDIVLDMTKLPFEDGSFDSVSFIANLNHVPGNIRDKELKEAYRCLRSGGNIIVTMPCAFAGILIHQFVYAYDKIFGTNYDVDTVRGMHEDEEYYLRDSDVVALLKEAGFKEIRKKYFGSQWGMNHMFIGIKR